MLTLPGVFWLLSMVTLPLEGFESTHTISGSMKPTLLVGDHYLTPVAGPYRPARGDVILFTHPQSGETWVKRLIGLPGDTVQMRGGIVFLNGSELPQTADGMFVETYAAQGELGHLPRCTTVTQIGARCAKEQRQERLPSGRSYKVLNIHNSAADDTLVFTVPPDHVFVLGDNRDNSVDSRIPAYAGGLGFVPLENVKARVSRVFISAGGPRRLGFWDWRADRFLMAVQ